MSIIQNGHQFQFGELGIIHDKLPVGNYLLKFNQNTGQFYLQQKEDFILPAKIYGDHSVVDRWLKSWQENSTKNMGILLDGLKGSGKTITAQKLCIDAQLPVIMITEGFHGPAFIDFITSPELGHCIIFIDEFEKITENNLEMQRDLLAIMDGGYMTHLLFVLTTNQDSGLNHYLSNRPGRIRYKKEYSSLDQDIIDAVIADLLVYPEHADSVREFFTRVGMCTFDLLTTIIKEVNLFNQNALECGSYLNIYPERVSYEGTIFIGDKKFSGVHTRFTLYSNSKYITIHPSQEARLYVRGLDHEIPENDALSDLVDDYDMTLYFDDITLDKQREALTITHNKTGVKIVLTEQKLSSFLA